ncbi:MAG: nitrile hydratase subunit beta [Gammaproteobacteria bacterium]|nr:nitrile hydratase subunit beta [Gammaproteobacteria bacterium]MCY4276500.1 nitrile hydratase subunit beta [Gammaproteobacteria bacterium]
MDGIHDLGGKQGFGKVVRERQEPAFHERWEASVHASMVAIAVQGWLGNIDRFRHAIERIDPAAYLTHTYYGRWLAGLETLLEESGKLTGGEIDARVRKMSNLDQQERLTRAARPRLYFETKPLSEDAIRGAQRETHAPPRFVVGDTVRTSRHGSDGHTRLPAYARDKIGRIVASHGAWVFPDTNAHGLGEQPCSLYTVAFEGSELWGGAGESDAEVCIDLFEPYLKRA